jgi:hypothetical protein
MLLRPLDGIPKLHATPLADVYIKRPRYVVVELDDEQENRIRLMFTTYQAVRVITADCFSLSEEIDLIPQTVVEIVESPWVKELAEELWRADHTATFMQKARHFLIPAQDDFIEVVAWNIACESIPPVSK